MCCVISPLYLGCISVCDTLNLNMTIASDAGQYTGIFTTHGTQVKIKKTFALGDALTFPITELNEKSGYYLTVLKPNGTQFNPNAVNDGFYFETILTKNIII